MSPAGRLRAALAAGLATLCAAAPATAADPAVAALAGRDAYVSPRVLGPAAAAGERTLAEGAAALREAGRPVKLAVVLGPVGAPSLQVYADRLATRLPGGATVVVTTRSGAVAAAAADGGRDLGPRLRAAHLERVANPVERLVRAARVAAVPVDPDEGDDDAVLALVGVALLGGGWAAAVGAGREGRLRRRALSEARALMRLRLDALRARAGALARAPGLTASARRGVQRALGAYAEVVPALQQARDPGAVEALEPRVREALATLSAAAAEAGVPFAADRPFEGLCAADPGHGPATAEGVVAGRDGPAPLCAACRHACDDGRPPAPRLLPRDGRPVPFDRVAVTAGPAAG